MLDSLRVNEWQARVLSELDRSEDAELVLLVVRDPAGQQRHSRRLTRQAIGDRVFWAWAERASRAAMLRPAELPSSLAALPRVTGQTVPVGRHRVAIAHRSLEAIRGHRPDVLLRFGFGILTGEILTLARYGVWSFHHGDETEYRGTPPGFWEMAENQRVIGVLLQRLTERLDGGYPLMKGWFATVPGSYGQTRDRLYAGGTSWPAAVCRRIRREGAYWEPAGVSADDAPIRRPPGPGVLIRFTLAMLRRRVSDGLRAATRHEHWNVGLGRGAPDDIVERLTLPGIAWAPERRGRYAADPFIRVRGDGAVDVLFEDYEHATGVAAIARTSLARGTWASPVTVLRTGTHLSYPFLLHLDGTPVLIPEAVAGREVAAYVGTPDLGAWTRRAALAWRDDIADPTLLRHSDRYWLFGSRAGTGHPSTELLLAFADRLEGPWTEHPWSPVVIDVRCARPAGAVFRVGDRLVRPAQDCSASYGGRIALREIVTLTPEAYAERTLGHLEPDPRGPYPDGLHTLNLDGGWIAIDGKRTTTSIRATGRMLRQRVGGGRR